MTKEELKNKYSAFITEISEILGLGKPIDVLKLCATTDLFFQPLEKHIEELEKENAELKEEQYITELTGISITRKELVMAIKALFDLENDKEELEKEADTPCIKCTNKGKCLGENKEAVYKICKKIMEAE